MRLTCFYPERELTHFFTSLLFRTCVLYAVLFVLAFWLYTVVWSTAPIKTPDSPGYLRAAQDLSDFHFDQLQERAPGYPLLLLLTESSQSPTRTLFFVSLSLHLISISLLASVLYCCGVKERMLNLFGLILLLPPYVEPAAYVQSESLAEVIIVAGFASFIFWCVHKRLIWLLVSAITIGYAGLVRPTYQLLALAVVGFLFVANAVLGLTALSWKDVMKSSSILIFGSVLTVGGYAFVNYQSVGYFGITPKLGLTLSLKTGRVIERLPNEYAAIREVLIKARNFDLVHESSHTGYTYIWPAVPELMRVTGRDYRHLSDYMLRINLLLIQRAPLNYLQEVAWAFGSYWFPPAGELSNFNSRFLQSLWGIIHFCLLGWFAVNLILLAGATTYLKMCKWLLKPGIPLPSKDGSLIYLQGLVFGFAGTIIFYTAAVSCLVEIGLPRYRLPTDSLIIFMALFGTQLWWRLVELSRMFLRDPQVPAV